MNLLNEKYRPKSIKTFVGNETAIASTKRFFMAWMKGKQKKNAILFHGGPGIGKTTLARILANDTGLEFTHLNASDLSRKDDIEPLAHNFQLSFDTDKLRIILIDEADRIAKRTQIGLVKAIQESSHPIVVVVNDLGKVSPALKKVCLVVPFQEIPTYLIKKLVLTISGKEKINLPNKVIDAILRYGKTPRDAINLLEDYSISGIIPDRIPFKELTDNEKMKMILAGDEVEMDNVQDALVWFGDSQIQDYELLADTDMVNRMNTFYSRKMIRKIRGGPLTSYPYSFRFKGMVNRAKKEEPKKEKKEKPKKMVKPKTIEKKEVDLMEWL